MRLDTYSGAPVDFAAYNVDPADVIVAGQNHAARPLDTTHRRPVVRWRFSPSAGYRFESNDVNVPLGNQEGFYVVEARRGDAVQQVWLNRTHVGLVTQESPGGIVLWGVDLRSGHAIANMDVAFLVGLQLITRRTDRNGLIAWNGPGRPRFALAEDGAGRAFVSFLPQAPLPGSIVGLRVESAVTQAGASLRFAGFARRRMSEGYRRATGDARVTLIGHGATLASTLVHLDEAGAFEGQLEVPAGVEAGEYAVLASAAGGVGGTSVQVDATGDVALRVADGCPCDPAHEVPVSIVARRGQLPAPGVAVEVVIVRSPHVVPPGAAEDSLRWGTTLIYERTVRTADDGRAHIAIPPSSDGLDSTYGIRATTRGATATSRIVVANAKAALALEPDAASVDVGATAAFDVRAFDPADGSAVANLPVSVRLSHGASVQEESVTLDARGRGRVVFEHASLGSNLALATATIEGRRALDAAAVSVEPSALSGRTLSPQAAVTVGVDKVRYAPADRIGVRASAPGAGGDALIALEGARNSQTRLASVSQGNASASLDLGTPAGAIRVWAAFVRDGAISMGSSDVNVDAPGHARRTELVLDKSSYAPGEAMQVTLREGAVRSAATIAVRVADGRESGPALFDDAPDVMLVGATNAQTSASGDPEWHAYVAPERSKASDIFAAERPRKVASDIPLIGAAAPRTMLWRVQRLDGETFELPAPLEHGHFVLSVLDIGDDGDVGAASASFTVP